MNKCLINAGICLLALTACGHAQQATSELVAHRITVSSPKSNYMNDINTRAVRDFVTRFTNVTDETWQKTNSGFIAVFIRDSVHYRVMYGTHGDLNYVMKYYEEPKFDRSVRAQIKSVYYDYSIFIVQEIESPHNPPVYIVNLQGEEDWKKVKFCNGEMEVLEEYKKSK